MLEHSNFNGGKREVFIYIRLIPTLKDLKEAISETELKGGRGICGAFARQLICCLYRGTTLTKKKPPVKPYSSPMLRALKLSYRCECFS